MKDGSYHAYGVFRDDLKARRIEPVIWNRNQIARNLDARHGAEIRDVGLVALSRNDSLSGCEIVPGVAFAMQLLTPSSETPYHAHAWWHVFVVERGAGRIVFSDKEVRVETSDIVFVPAWCKHKLLNDTKEPFITLNLSNMPQQSDLANFESG